MKLKERKTWNQKNPQSFIVFQARALPSSTSLAGTITQVQLLVMSLILA